MQDSEIEALVNGRVRTVVAEFRNDLAQRLREAAENARTTGFGDYAVRGPPTAESKVFEKIACIVEETALVV